MYNKNEIKQNIDALKERLKTSAPIQHDQLNASLKVWEGRLRDWKAEPEQETVKPIAPKKPKSKKK
jgi:hypothetical protein